MRFRVTYRTPDGGRRSKLVEGRDRRDAVFSFQVAFPAFRVIGVEREAPMANPARGRSDADD